VRPQTWREVGDQLGAVGGVDDLRMELDAVEAARLVRDDRIGRTDRGGDRDEAGGDRVDLVAVTHPDLVAFAFGPESVEQRAGRLDVDERAAELAAVARDDDVAAELRRHDLLTVADAEDRHAGVEQTLRCAGRGFQRDRGGAARQDDALRLHPLERLFGGLEGGDFAVDAGFANTARDELGDLAAKVDDENAVGMLHAGRIAGWDP
jgi:hypothetical protein